jgi:hypothetical protein
MVTNGFAAHEIKNYLSRWCIWWAKTNAEWTYQQLLIELIQTTHQDALKILGQALYGEQFGTLKTIVKVDKTLLAQVTL